MPKTQKTPPKLDLEIADNWSEIITRTTVTEHIDPALKMVGLTGRQLSGRLEIAGDRKDVCYLALEWPGSPAQRAEREGSRKYIEDFPLELLELLGELIPALVAQARRDGVADLWLR